MKRQQLYAGQWEPDQFLIDAARASRIQLVEMCGPDRSWIVAGLTAEGLTADDVARRTHCSLRLIRHIRAEPMTVVATYAVQVQRKLDLAETALSRLRQDYDVTMAGLRRDIARLTAERNRLIDDAGCDRWRAGMPRLPWNAPVLKGA